MDISEKTGDQKNVLVVDDDIAHRKLISTYINRMGMPCSSAENGVEALKKLERSRFNLVVTDLNMPEMGGLELLKKLKQDESIDIIVMTGYIDDYKYIDIIRAGASDFINKPIQREEFEAKVYRVFHERDLVENVKKNKNKLEESNAALKVLIKNIEQEKKEVEESLHVAIEARIAPFVNKLEKLCDKGEQRECIENIRSNINDLMSPVVRLSYAKKNRLTVNELQVADMVQKGLTSKEIADKLNISYRTVEKYRGKIRKKCGFSNSKINLRTILSE